MDRERSLVVRGLALTRDCRFLDVSLDLSHICSLDGALLIERGGCIVSISLVKHVLGMMGGVKKACKTLCTIPNVFPNCRGTTLVVLAELCKKRFRI